MTECKHGIVLGYGTFCGECMCEAIPPARITGTNYTYVAVQKGWECPRCNSVYAPFVPKCMTCGPTLKYEVTCGADNGGPKG